MDCLKILSDHPTSLAELTEQQALGVQYSQIRRGPELFAVLAVKGGNLPAEVMDTLANVIGLVLMRWEEAGATTLLEKK